MKKWIVKHKQIPDLNRSGSIATNLAQNPRSSPLPSLLKRNKSTYLRTKTRIKTASEKIKKHKDYQTAIMSRDSSSQKIADPEKFTNRIVSQYYSELQRILKRKRGVETLESSNKKQHNMFITLRPKAFTYSHPQTRTNVFDKAAENAPNPFHKFFCKPRLDDIVTFDSGHIFLNRKSSLLKAFFDQLTHIYAKRSSGNLALESLKTHLQARYTNPVAEKVLKVLNPTEKAFNFDLYCEMIERLLNLSYEDQMRLCFDIYDNNSDGEICEKDLLQLIEKLEDDIFLSVFSYDIMKFVAFFEKRKVMAAESLEKISKKCILDTLEEESHKMLKFEDFINVEFVEGVPELLDDILSYLCVFRYRYQVNDDSQGLLGINSECVRVREEYKLECSDVQLLNLQMAFKKLARNPSNNYSMMYLTHSSISSSFNSVLGFHNNYLAAQFYLLLSDGEQDKPIYVDTFILKLCRLLLGNAKQRAYFAFRIYDFDMDRYVGLMDLHIFLASLPKGSLIWSEVKQVIDRYISNKIVEPTKTAKLLSFADFWKMLPNSVLIQEFRFALFKEGREIINKKIQRKTRKSLYY